MQLQHIPSEARYAMKEGWLETRHHFSFADYHDPQNVHFGALRVFNDDWIAPASGFGTHPHAEMEIVTILLEGELEHRDTTGGHAVLRVGEVQRMTAGTGIAHSEANPSPSTRTHLLQIWVFPEAKGLTPGYVQRRFDPADREGRLQRIVTRTPVDGELDIHQDADFYLGTLLVGKPVIHEARPGRRQYVFVIRGAVRVGDRPLAEGDQARITGAEGPLTLEAVGDRAEVVLIDLP